MSTEILRTLSAKRPVLIVNVRLQERNATESRLHGIGRVGWCSGSSFWTAAGQELQSLQGNDNKIVNKGLREETERAEGWKQRHLGISP